MGAFSIFPPPPSVRRGSIRVVNNDFFFSRESFPSFPPFRGVTLLAFLSGDLPPSLFFCEPHPKGGDSPLFFLAVIPFFPFSFA